MDYILEAEEVVAVVIILVQLLSVEMVAVVIIIVILPVQQYLLGVGLEGRDMVVEVVEVVDM